MINFPELSLNISEQEYRDIPNVSFSLITSFIREGPKVLNEKKNINTPSLTFGSLVDTLMTDNENFDNVFYITDLNISNNESVRKVIEALYSMGYDHTVDLNDISEEVLQLCDENELYKSYSKAVRLSKLSEYGLPYLEIMSNIKGRKIASKKDLEDAQRVCGVLKGNPYTSIFFNDWEAETLGIEKIYQPKFVSVVNDVDVKCMCDIILVNHKKKVIQVADLKTTSENEENFEDKYLKFRYDIQATLYPHIVENITKQDPYFKKFSFLPFKFIVVNRYLRKPLVYEDDLYQRIKSGNMQVLNGEPYKNYMDYLSEIKYHLDNQKFDYTYESIKNNGLKKINVIKDV